MSFMCTLNEMQTKRKEMDDRIKLPHGYLHCSFFESSGVLVRVCYHVTKRKDEQNLLPFQDSVNISYLTQARRHYAPRHPAMKSWYPPVLHIQEHCSLANVAHQDPWQAEEVLDTHSPGSTTLQANSGFGSRGSKKTRQRSYNNMNHSLGSKYSTEFTK